MEIMWKKGWKKKKIKKWHASLHTFSDSSNSFVFGQKLLVVFQNFSCDSVNICLLTNRCGVVFPRQAKKMESMKKDFRIVEGFERVEILVDTKLVFGGLEKGEAISFTLLATSLNSLSDILMAIKLQQSQNSLVKDGLVSPDFFKIGETNLLISKFPLLCS